MTGGRPIGDDDLQALVDGRLAPERRDAVEAYLAAHPAAADRIAADREQREALRSRLAFKAAEPIPARLRVANIEAERRLALSRRLAAVAAAGAWLVLGATFGWFANGWFANGRFGPEASRLAGSRLGEVPAGAASAVAHDAFAAYRTYVVEAAHPVEVGATQEVHLVQWLSRRLGKPLSAPDLRAQGFRLMGGRLLPAGLEPAALFMYDDDRGTRLTLYARSNAGEDRTAFRFEAEGDVAAFSWIDRGLSYVITARTDRDRLLAVAEAVHHELDKPRKDSL